MRTTPECSAMIVVRVELWSAVTGAKTELARKFIRAILDEES